MLFRVLASTAVLAVIATPSLAATPGEQVFIDNCAACHQRTGQGIPGAFPALNGDKFVTGAPDPVVGVLLNGRGGMPAFRNELTNAQIGLVISYVRGAWSNKAGPVPETKVAAVRGRGDMPAKGLQAH
jgi:cytochrome c6